MSDALAGALIAKAVEIGALAAGMADADVPYRTFYDEAEAMLQRNGFSPEVAGRLAYEYTKAIAIVKARDEIAAALSPGGIQS